MGGKDAKEPKSSKRLGRIAFDLYRDASPIRNQLNRQSMDFLRDGLDVSQSPVFGPMKNTLESQFSRARENTLSNVPAGGALTSALTDLEGQRAMGLAQAVGSIADQELGRAITLGTGATQTAAGGLGQSGAIQAQIANANAQRDAAAKQSFGEGAGAILGGK